MSKLLKLLFAALAMGPVLSLSSLAQTATDPAKIALDASLLVSVAASATAPSVTFSQTLPEVSLRGYGKVSGRYGIDSQGRSILEITCTNTGLAKLAQAKYLSDLHTFSGVIPITVGTNVSAFEVSDQGDLAALRSGSQVWILEAPSAGALTSLLSQVPAGAVSTSDAKVPMYLDRWDKYSFRYYYGPFTTPPNVSDYDPTQDFQFAHDTHGGLQIWDTPGAVEEGEGMTDLNNWDWTAATAEKFGLPFGVNSSIDDHMSWLINRYPEDFVQYHPQFLGTYYGSLNWGMGLIPSWNSGKVQDLFLADMQQDLRKTLHNPSITSWLEPHAEMGHGVADLLVDYGPVADRGYRDYLRKTYGSIGVLSQRWYGDANRLKTWDDVHVPELASFEGWGPDAIDLTGIWKASWDAPYTAASAAPGLDDSAWADIPAPGNGIARFVPPKNAVYRRHFKVDAAWLAAHPKVWLYVWDLNGVRSKDDFKQQVHIYLNGQLLPEEPLQVTDSHWVGLPVDSVLVARDNQVTVLLTQGMFNYRVYLSPQAPQKYPDLGKEGNARWVDFFDWNTASRVAAVRRGMQMIRQVDPNRGIMLMAPGPYLDGIWTNALDYGGDFHDTGGMAASFEEQLPAVARGAGLPMSAEPGGPAKTALEFKEHFGYWISEGVNAIDYFLQIGDVEWNPEIKKCMEDNVPIFTSIGKYHAPTAQVAALYSPRNEAILDFPWTDGQGYGGYNMDHLGSGCYRWNVRAVLRGVYESDALTESGLESKQAANYPVIIDTNTSILDEKPLAAIEAYVRGGGTFVTFVQTGRHTSIAKDAWPIEKLTGYHVTRLSQAQPWQTDMLTWAKDEPVFSGDWMNQVKADGLSLKKIATDTQDLAYWKDGSVAIGMRPLGKGRIIEVGCRFTSWGLPDRIDRDIAHYLRDRYGRAREYGLPNDDKQPLYTPELLATQKLFAQILQWRAIKPVPAHIEASREDVFLRHFISNNGLFDVWTIYNQSSTQSATGNVVLDADTPWRINLLDGSKASVTNRRMPVSLQPQDTVIYLTPRRQLATSALSWFDLQREWWKGTTNTGAPLAPFKAMLTAPIGDDWSFKPLDPKQTDVTALVDPKFDDSSWKKMRLGIFGMPDYPEVRHALFRKRITIPAAWNHGRVQLWIQGVQDAFNQSGSVFVDGQLVQRAGSHGVDGYEDDGKFTPGSTHLVAVEITGTSNIPLGVAAPAWLYYHPAPEEEQPLAGNWAISQDGLRYAAPTALPGVFDGKFARETVAIAATHRDQTVVLHENGEQGTLRGVIINGRLIERNFANIGSETDLNLTPWVRFGADNEIILLTGGPITVRELSLEFHAKGAYP